MSTGSVPTGLGQVAMAQPSAPPPQLSQEPLHVRVAQLEARVDLIERQNSNQANAICQLVNQIQELRSQIGLNLVDESTFLTSS